MVKIKKTTKTNMEKRNRQSGYDNVNVNVNEWIEEYEKDCSKPDEYSYHTTLRIGNKCQISYIKKYKVKHKLRNRFYTVQGILYITSLHTEEKYRGNGYASKLLKFSIKQAKENGIRYVELEDMSDNFRKDRNIYINHGFKYCHDYGPEMFLKF